MTATMFELKPRSASRSDRERFGVRRARGGFAGVRGPQAKVVGKEPLDEFADVRTVGDGF